MSSFVSFSIQSVCVQSANTSHNSPCSHAISIIFGCAMHFGACSMDDWCGDSAMVVRRICGDVVAKRDILKKCTVLCLGIVINVIRASCEIREINVSPQINILKADDDAMIFILIGSRHFVSLSFCRSSDGGSVQLLRAHSPCSPNVRRLRSRYFFMLLFFFFSVVWLSLLRLYTYRAPVFDCELEKEFFPGIDSVSIFYTFMCAGKILPKEMHVAPFICANRLFLFSSFAVFLSALFSSAVVRFSLLLFSMRVTQIRESIP